MGNREIHPCVEGTAALKIGRQRTQGGPRVIRVDFRATNDAAVREGSVRHEARSPHIVALERPARYRGRVATPLRGDAAVVIQALGLREMRDELEDGTAAGIASESSLAVALACCTLLFAFCLFVLTL